MVVDLQSFGPVLFAAGKVKHIRDGLFQYRQRFSERLLLRAYFFSTAGNRLLILSAYNKQKDPSKKRQQNEIFRALKQKKMLEMYVLKQIE